MLQGYQLPPHLFNLYPQRGTGRTHGKLKDVGGLQITNLRYESDIVLAKASEKRQVMTSNVFTTYNNHKLRMNRQKTKAMRSAREGNALNIYINGGRVERVNCFKYLGVQFIEDQTDRIDRGYAVVE